MASQRPKRRRPGVSEFSTGALIFPTVEPHSMPVHGAQLLSDLVSRLKCHSILPQHGAETVALWILFAWAFDAWTIAPLLQISAPERASGKSRLLEVIGALVPKPLATGSISAAAMFRVIEAHCPTLLVDEVDTFLKENHELVGVLNNGHLRSQAYVVRCHGEDHEVKPFCVWSPKVLCGIGDLPDTLASRCISIQMKRKRPSEKVERLRADQLAWATELQSRCARWAVDQLEQLRDADPHLPDELDDRAQDNWRPLVAIADQVGGGWPQMARAAAVAISAPLKADKASRGVQLLQDIRLVFDQEQVSAIAPEKLVAALRKLLESPWAIMGLGGGLTALQVAKLLAPYGIHSQRNHEGRYFDRRDFEDTWARYCPEVPQEPVASVTPDTQAGSCGSANEKGM